MLIIISKHPPPQSLSVDDMEILSMTAGCYYYNLFHNLQPIKNIPNYYIQYTYNSSTIWKITCKSLFSEQHVSRISIKGLLKVSSKERTSSTIIIDIWQILELYYFFREKLYRFHNIYENLWEISKEKLQNNFTGPFPYYHIGSIQSS